ncbi:MAG: M20/M25/M40 family metallo-hydrolase [Anaerolineales bacterium]|nr:M20/M25/M40 family metallo-hydrolase [Anaerolineales bacterium]
MKNRISGGSLIDGAIWASETMEDDLLTLVDEFGPRWSGTTDERWAAEWLAHRLDEIGLERVGLDHFEYTGWRDIETRLAVIVEDRETHNIPAIAHIYSPPTPPGGLKAPLVHVGAGRPRQFEAVKDEIEGSFVLCETTPWPIFFKGYEAAASPIKMSMDYGAAGFILMGATPGAGPRVGCCSRGKMGSMPVMGIGKEEGEFIKRTLERARSVMIELDSQTDTRKTTGCNVVGEIGDGNGGLVLLTAHYDGHRIGQGAQDNASGVISILEAARVLKTLEKEFNATIRVVFFGAEELGLLGAEAYAEQHKDELDRMQCILNIDIAWPPFGLAVQASAELAAAVREINRRMDLGLDIYETLSLGTDHEPFVKQGVPAIVYEGAAGPGEYPYPHTGADTFDKIDLHGVKQAASLTCKVIASLASRDRFPAQRLSPGDLDAFLQSGS